MRGRSLVWLAGCVLALGRQVAAQPVPLSLEAEVQEIDGHLGGDGIALGEPSIALGDAGNGLVVWTRTEFDPSVTTNLYARRYDAAGHPVGSELQIDGSPRATYSSVVRNGSGFVVVWESTGEDGDGQGIRALRLDGTATPIGTEFGVNSTTVGEQLQPSVASDASGEFVVAWRSGSSYQVAADVLGQRFDATGAPLGTEFAVNTTPAIRNSHIAVGRNAAGETVIAWSRYFEDPTTEIRARRFDATGAPMGPDFRVAAAVAEDEELPAVGVAPGGNFVVAWLRDTSGISARRFDAAGTPEGPEFSVADASANDRPVLAFEADGSLVIVWTAYPYDPQTTRQILGRRYDPSGSAVGGTFALGALGRVAGRYDPAIGADAGGGFSAAWITHIPAKGGVCNDPNLSFCQRVVVHARRYAFEAPIPGDRVSVRDDADPTHRRIDVMSKTSVISTAPGISLDPITNGAWLQVYNATGSGESVCLPLPAVGWSATGAPSTPGLRYRDTAAAYGPCSRAELRHGKQLKVSCLARTHPIAYSLDEVSQGAVAVRLASGTASYCMVFGGLVRHDSHVEFKALRAPTPVSCAPPPVPCP